MPEILFKEESFKIVGAAMEVHRELGCGFTENVYQDALEYEFQLQEIPYVREKSFIIPYKGIILNKEFRADFVCFDQIVVELKAVEEFTEYHEAQILNYLKVSGLALGLLMNFGTPSFDSKRYLRNPKW